LDGEAHRIHLSVGPGTFFLKPDIAAWERNRSQPYEDRGRIQLPHVQAQLDKLSLLLVNCLGQKLTEDTGETIAAEDIRLEAENIFLKPGPGL
jgi:hypothetical protein